MSKVKKFLGGSVLVAAGMAAGLGLAATNKKVRKYIVDLGEKVDKEVNGRLGKLGKKKAKQEKDDNLVEDIVSEEDKNK